MTAADVFNPKKKSLMRTVHNLELGTLLLRHTCNEMHGPLLRQPSSCQCTLHVVPAGTAPIAGGPNYGFTSGQSVRLWPTSRDCLLKQKQKHIGRRKK